MGLQGLRRPLSINGVGLYAGALQAFGEAGHVAAFDWHKLRVLILDGDRSFAAWAAGVLGGRGATEVRDTSSATQGFHLLREFPADVVLVETRMPDVSGVDFVRWLRDPQSSPNTELPLVLTTARPEAATLRQACELGIESFMQKPIEEDKFLRRLATTVRQPRRFVIGGSYFGPDRRRAQQPFEGVDRRVSRVMQGEATHVPRPARPDPAWVAFQVQQDATPPEAPGAQAAATEPDLGVSHAAPGSHGEAAPQVGAERRRSAAAPPAGPRPRIREWQDDLPEETAKPRPRADVPLIDDVAKKNGKPGNAERWKELLAEGETAPARPEPIDLGPILSDHGLWLRSNGREGKRAMLAELDLSGSELDGARLANADMHAANLSDATCREADFQGADMRHANLSSADVSSGNLGVARLRHADMRRAKLDGANMRGTDLAGANMRGASLNDADLGGANLLSTDIRNTDLSGVRGLTQVQLAKVRADSSTRLPPGLRLPRKEG